MLQRALLPCGLQTAYLFDGCVQLGLRLQALTDKPG